MQIQNYEPGYDFDELWSLDINSGQWAHVGAGGSASPGKRYLLSMTAVAGQLVLYGGMQEGQGDVWAFSLEQRSWIRLAVKVLAAQGGPGRRVGHQLMPFISPTATGFLMHGGRSIEGNVSKLHGDVFFFDLSSNTWRELVATSVTPPPRKYHALLHTELELAGGFVMVGIIAGGTTTSPGLTCAAGESGMGFWVWCVAPPL
jgi:hypothetical protein